MARHHRGKRHYSQADVYSIARSEGAADHEARFLAGVVPPESGGDAWVVNSIGATGLVQIYDGHFPSPQRIKFLQNPRNNIREGLHKLRTQGPGAWAASRSGWRPFRGRGSGATGGSGGAGGTLTTPGRQDVALSRQTTFDRAGFEKARKLALVGQLIAKRKGTDSPLFKTGLLTTQAPSQGDFMNTRLVSKVVQHGGGPSVSLGGGAAAPGNTKVMLAPGADRPGVKTSHYLRRVLSGVAGIPGGITITTGSNHNQMTVNGNQSDHWTGHAADIGVPVDSPRGDLIAGRVLMRLGVPRARARQMARHGGLFNVQYGGHRWQVIWKTYEGGNHHNHVHVGVR
jgi:hypothetical protein